MGAEPSHGSAVIRQDDDRRGVGFESRRGPAGLAGFGGWRRVCACRFVRGGPLLPRRLRHGHPPNGKEIASGGLKPVDDDPRGREQEESSGLLNRIGEDVFTPAGVKIQGIAGWGLRPVSAWDGTEDFRRHQCLDQRGFPSAGELMTVARCARRNRAVIVKSSTLH